jgi:hypothetical protein
MKPQTGDEVRSDVRKAYGLRARQFFGVGALAGTVVPLVWLAAHSCCGVGAGKLMFCTWPSMIWLSLNVDNPGSVFTTAVIGASILANALAYGILGLVAWVAYRITRVVLRSFERSGPGAENVSGPA